MHVTASHTTTPIVVNCLHNKCQGEIESFMTRPLHSYTLVMAVQFELQFIAEIRIDSWSFFLMLFTMFLLTGFLVCLSRWNFVIDFKLTSDELETWNFDHSSEVANNE